MPFRLSFIVVEVLFLAIAHVYGGTPWAIVGMIAFMAQIFTQVFSGIRPESLLLVVPSLIWLVLFRVTGNRELFFPYTMFLATGVAVRAVERSPWLGMLGGGAVVTAFMVIRVLQNATTRVLAVELVIAAAIAGATLCPLVCDQVLGGLLAPSPFTLGELAFFGGWAAAMRLLRPAGP
jgi:hypothetical protein